MTKTKELEEKKKMFVLFSSLRNPEPSFLLGDPGLLINLLLTKKDVQLENCELSFIWGKMRTAAWETAPQRAERLLQRDRGKGQYINYSGKAGSTCDQAHLFLGGFY